MNILAAATQAYKDDKSVSVPNLAAFYDKIYEWMEVYRGTPPWSHVKRSGLYRNGERIMNMLNGAKVLSDEFALQCFAEQVDISLDDDKAKAWLDDVLNANGFWKQLPELLSKGFAQGGCALREYIHDGRVCIDFIEGKDFAPISWSNRNVTDGIFETVTYKGGSYYTLLELHTLQAGGVKIESRLYKSSDVSTIGVRCPVTELYPDLPDFAVYDSVHVPVFQYWKPDIANNIESYNPLGISVYANALDTLEALDVAFDSLAREFILGKKRIIVPSSCVRTVTDIDTGKQTRYFDADDEAYVALQCEEEKDLKITDNTVELRVDEHVKAINALLNILCFQTGLSAGALSFDTDKGMKTATEVVSEDSKTARTMKGNKNLLAEMLEGMCISLLALGGSLGQIAQKDYDVVIGFKDNIVIDDNTLIDNNVKLVQAGLKSKLSAVMEVLKCDEETAQQELDRIAKEANITGGALDDLFGGDKA